MMTAIIVVAPPAVGLAQVAALLVSCYDVVVLMLSCNLQ